MKKGIAQVVYEMKRFRWVIFDEAHYLMQDSLFNSKILFWDDFFIKVKNVVKIFMSATLEEVERGLLKYLPGKLEPAHRERYIPESICGMFKRNPISFGYVWRYKVHNQETMKDVKYFRELGEIAEIINTDDSTQKWLVFVSNKKKGEKFYRELQCSKAYIDADTEAEECSTLQQIISSEKYNEKVLVCTQILDNGVNLWDEDLQNIVLNTVDQTEFLQMIGRKRSFLYNSNIRNSEKEG